MKFCLWVYLFASAIASCRSDFEFGRAAFEEDLDMEDALRELMISYDMSMSMSMSFSYSYDYGGGHVVSGSSGSDSHSGSNSQDGVSDGDSSNGDGWQGPHAGSPHATPTPSVPSPEVSPVPTPTLAPAPSTGGSPSSPTSPTTAPATAAGETSTATPETQSPSALSRTVDQVVPAASLPPVAFPLPLPSCFGMEHTTFESPLFAETSKDSVSFALLRNRLTDAMRGRLPFCEDLSGQRKLEDAGAVAVGPNSNYFIGNVGLVGVDKETCTPKSPGNKCFVGALTLKLFGGPTQADVRRILGIIKGLLESGRMGEVLSVENGSLVDPDTDSTQTDSDRGSGSPQAATSSRRMSAGTKALISVLVIVAVAFVAIFAYLYRRNRNERGNNGYVAGRATEDHENVYGV